MMFYLLSAPCPQGFYNHLFANYLIIVKWRQNYLLFYQ